MEKRRLSYRSKWSLASFFPYLLGISCLSLALIGGFLSKDSTGIDGINWLVESISGNIGSYFSNINLLIPLGFSFTAGMVTAVNPCGSVLLPAYLGLYLGSGDTNNQSFTTTKRLRKAVTISLAVTLGFFLLFGLSGIIVSQWAQFAVSTFPWIGLLVGITLVIGGTWLLAGGEIYNNLAGELGARLGQKHLIGIRGYILFGISYGIASLSCSLPMFLLVISSTAATSDFWMSLLQFLLYAFGMGFIITALTVSIALFEVALVKQFRIILPYTRKFGCLLMILAGSYVVYYWLTLGDLI